ncbi:MAG TPA: sigma factor [Ferruginibacter sp.]|nr:sigma factor [Ferruginibacter sp.]HPH91173.1 sigma factor [Ferruginibacter sp.]
MRKENSPATEDCDLAIAAGLGNREAFGRLYDKYAPPLMGIITRTVEGGTSAEQILQSTFMHILKQIDLFDASRNSFFTWLLTIARQQVIANTCPADLKKPAANNIVYSTVNNNNTWQPHLAAGEVLIFDLFFYNGMNFERIASIIKRPVEDVKKDIRQVIKNINSK